MIKIAIESQTSRPGTFMPESSTPSIFAQEISLSQAFTSLTLAPSTSTEQFHSVFRFLHLPAEVRNQIYDLAVKNLPCKNDPGYNRDLPLHLYNFHMPMSGLGLTCKILSQNRSVTQKTPLLEHRGVRRRSQCQGRYGVHGGVRDNRLHGDLAQQHGERIEGDLTSAWDQGAGYR